MLYDSDVYVDKRNQDDIVVSLNTCVFMDSSNLNSNLASLFVQYKNIGSNAAAIYAYTAEGIAI